MPSKTTLERAREDAREGKSPTTQAGEFVHEEIEHIREGKHGARSTKQAIAIGLSKARRAGIALKPPKRGRTSEATRHAAEIAYEEGQGTRKPKSPSRKRSRAVEKALKREGKSAASHAALSRHAKSAAAARRRRGGVTEGVDRPASARKRTTTRTTRKRAAQPRKRASSGRKRATSGKRATSAKTQRRRRAAASA
jgi:hypothetical protein